MYILPFRILPEPFFTYNFTAYISYLRQINNQIFIFYIFLWFLMRLVQDPLHSTVSGSLKCDGSGSAVPTQNFQSMGSYSGCSVHGTPVDGSEDELGLRYFFSKLGKINSVGFHPICQTNEKKNTQSALKCKFASFHKPLCIYQLFL